MRQGQNRQAEITVISSSGLSGSNLSSNMAPAQTSTRVAQSKPFYKNPVFAGVTLCSCIIALVAAILVALCFSYLEYNEYGFKRQKSTGKVWLDKIYTGGRYLFGPDYDFLVYRADAHLLDLIEIDVFTHDKLEVKLTAHLQYFIRKDELVLLHKMFNIYYEDVMKTSAIDALKGAIPIYSTRELIQNRSEVESELYRAVRQRIGGVCCRPNCTESEQACLEDCTPVESCSDDDKGLHADVVYFQLGHYIIPSDVETRYMEALVLQETTLREKLLQNASVIRKKTEAMVRNIKNEAAETIANATANGQLIGDVAQADYMRIREQSKIIGLANCFRLLNITEQEKKLSYDYLRALVENEKVRLDVNFEQLVAGDLSKL